MRISLNVADVHLMNKLCKEPILVEASDFMDKRDNTIHLTTRDTKTDNIIEMIAIGEVIEEGDMVLTSKVIYNLPKSGELILSCNDDNCNAKCGKRKINFKNTESSEPVNTYAIDTFYEFTYQDFMKMIEVEFATAQDEARPILKGIHIGKNDFAALDGYRLAVRKGDFIDPDNYSEITIPITIIKLFRKLPKVDKVKMGFDNNNIVIQAGSIRIINSLMEGEYINYQSLIPNKSKTITTVNAKELLRLLNSYKNVKIVNLKIYEEIMIVTASNKNISITDKLSCDTLGESVEINFNIKYLVDAFKNYKSDVEICLNNPLSPMLIKDDEGRLDLVSPVRLINEK